MHAVIVSVISSMPLAPIHVVAEVLSSYLNMEASSLASPPLCLIFKLSTHAP
jgi:hypothetical protein